MVHIANLSVPSPGKWISKLFGIFWHFFPTMFWTNHFQTKMISGGSLGQSANSQSFVYWSSNFEVFTQIRVVHWKFPSFVSFFSKTILYVFTIQKFNSKENSYFPTSFGALVLLCGRWYCYLGKNNFWKKWTPMQGQLTLHRWICPGNCSNRCKGKLNIWLLPGQKTP